MTEGLRPVRAACAVDDLACKIVPRRHAEAGKMEGSMNGIIACSRREAADKDCLCNIGGAGRTAALIGDDPKFIALAR